MSTDSTSSGIDISEMTNKLFELTDGLVFFLDKECNIIVTNSSVLIKTGYNLEELKGRKIFDLISSDIKILKENFQSSITKNGSFQQEIEFINKDKSTFQAESINYLVLDENGEIEYIISKNRDITEQKLADKKLQSSETRFRELFDNMSSGVAIYEVFNDGEDFIFKDFNKAGEKIDKINRKELIGKKITEIFPRVKEFGFLDALKRVWETGNPEDLPVSQYQDNRIIGWRDNYIYKLPSGDIIAVYDDVTEQKSAEKHLKENVDKARLVFDSINDGMLIYSLSEKKFKEVNKTICNQLGYKMDELLQKSPIDINSEEDRDSVMREFLRLELEEGSTFETMHLAKNGKLIPTELSFKNVIVQDDPSILIIARDIRERRKIQEELQRSKNNLGERVKEITVLYAISNLLTKTHLSIDALFPSILTIIPAAWKYAENTVARITYEGENYTSPGFEITPWKQSAEINIEGVKIGEIEVYYRDEKPEEDEGPFLKEERDLLNTISQEISIFIIRKKIEEELRLKNQAMESSINAIGIIDLDYKISYVNQSFIKLFGYDNSEELVMKSVTEFSAKPEKSMGNIQNSLKDGGWIGEVKAKRKDGEIFDAQISLSMIFDINNNPINILASFVDITERRITEQKLDVELQTNIALAELSRAILDKDTIEEIADLVLDYARKFTE
ncbi:MAG: PAS domain-containing protein, partial [Candidatus Heimdallarchaeaceae archaeon]